MNICIFGNMTKYDMLVILWYSLPRIADSSCFFYVCATFNNGFFFTNALILNSIKCGKCNHIVCDSGKFVPHTHTQTHSNAKISFNGMWAKQRERVWAKLNAALVQRHYYPTLIEIIIIIAINQTTQTHNRSHNMYNWLCIHSTTWKCMSKYVYITSIHLYLVVWYVAWKCDSRLFTFQLLPNSTALQLSLSLNRVHTKGTTVVCTKSPWFPHNGCVQQEKAKPFIFHFIMMMMVTLPSIFVYCNVECSAFRIQRWKAYTQTHTNTLTKTRRKNKREKEERNQTAWRMLDALIYLWPWYIEQKTEFTLYSCDCVYLCCSFFFLSSLCFRVPHKYIYVPLISSALSLIPVNF